MTVHSVALTVTVVAGAWVAGYSLLFVHRRPRGVLVAMLAAFASLGAISSLTMDGGLDASWNPVGLAVLLTAYASLPIFVTAYPVSPRAIWRTRTFHAVALPAFVLAAAGPSAGLSVEDAFLPSTELRHVVLNSFLVACLGIALAEALALRFRSRVHRREAYLVVLGVLVLIVAGPMYRFEAILTGLPDLNGANWAAPVAGACFAVGLRLGDALRVRGRASAPAMAIPWPVPSGFLLVSEARPKYARAMFLAAIQSRSRTGLAVLGGDPDAAPELAGVEAVRLPPGDRCASVLAATVSEFLARFPEGVVCVDDFSYAVAHSGLPASVESAVRMMRVAPPKATVLVSLTKLTHAELRALEAAGLPLLRAPDFGAGLGRVLDRHLGADSGMLSRIASARGLRVEDLSFAEMPHVLDTVVASIREMHAAGDEAARSAWPQVAAALAADLETFWRTPPTATGSGAGVSERVPDFPLTRAGELVLADGRVEETPHEDIGHAVQVALVGCLGPAGEPIFRRVLGTMRKDVFTLRREDVPRAAAIADAAITDLENALDSEAARSEIVQRRDRLRAILRGIGEDGS